MAGARVPFWKTLSGRMLVLGILPTALVLLGIIGLLASSMFDALRAQNEHAMQILVDRVAAEIERGNTRAVLMAQVMAAAQTNGMFGDRLASVDYARQILADDPELTGAYFGYEPDADGQDQAYLLPERAEALGNALGRSGRFIPYWYRAHNDNELLLLEPLVDMESSLYYQGCKERFLAAGEPVPMVTEPYVYEGKMIVEQTFPIVIRGEFRGIAGVDRALSDIERFLEGVKQRDGVDVFLVSSAGRFVAATSEGENRLIASEQALHTRAIADTAYAGLFGPLYAERSERGFVLAEDPVDGVRHYYASSPVPTGDWMVVVRRSEDAVLAPIRRQLQAVLGLLAVGLSVVLGVSLWVTTSTSRRIRRAVAAADRLALGDVSLHEALDTRADDETARLCESFNRLVESYRSITAMCQAIAQGDFSQRFERRSDRDELAGALNDMSDKRRLAEEAVLRARDAAEEANRAKSDFLAKMSHELRTPMNAIIGYSEMLQEEAEEAGQEEFIPDLQKIRAAGKHLLALINDILDLSKIEAGRMDLYLESFDVQQTVDEVVHTIRPLAEKNSNQVEVECGSDVGEMHSDLVKVRQGLFNLLSNACKFTENGVIRLSAQRRGGPDGDWMVFEVSDTGIGMDAEQVGKIFEAFGQADSSTTRRFGGTGLGLTITRRFCEMMGGRIDVDSTLGEGSRFVITLPVEARVPVSAELEPEEPFPAGAGGPEVLVIDDDPVARDLLVRTLGRDGFSVVAARSGEEGLALAKERGPVAITLDVMMPGLDGWAVLKQLKADPDTAAIPVVMVTILQDDTLAYSLGATDFLTKPVDRDRLVTLLAKHAGVAARSALVVEDDPDTRSLLTRLLEREGWRVREAEHGRAGLDRLEEELPDLILLDLMMPVMDGFEFLRTLRTREGWREVPVVVVTAKELSAEERAFFEGAAEQVVRKGAGSRELLLDELAKLLRSHARSAPAGQG